MILLLKLLLLVVDLFGLRETWYVDYQLGLMSVLLVSFIIGPWIINGIADVILSVMNFLWYLLFLVVFLYFLTVVSTIVIASLIIDIVTTGIVVSLDLCSAFGYIMSIELSFA